jgi:tetratricopeptide (TPR) repeat protein
MACNSDIKKAKEHYLKAEKYYTTKDYANASLEIDKSINLDASNYEYLIYSAKIKRQLNKNDEAIDLLKTVISKNYKKDSTNYEIGKCYFAKSVNFSNEGESESKQNESLEKALDFYDLTLKENIRFYDAYIEKYKVMHNLQRYEEAIVIVNQAYSVFPDSINLVLFRGVAKGTLGDHYEEMKDLNKAISSKKLDSSNTSTAYRFRGLAFKEKDELKLALEDFTNAINYSKENAYPYKDRGDLYLKMKLNDSACKDYRKAAELGFVKLYEIIKENCN